MELFNGNTVEKKVLCITDRDFKWIKKSDGTQKLSDYNTYSQSNTPHIDKLTDRFQIDNFRIVTQAEGGRTFEDELFLTNLSAGANDDAVAQNLMKLVANDTVLELLRNHGLSFIGWKNNRPTTSNSVVSAYLDAFSAAIDKDGKNKDDYMRLFFAELFLYYASAQKGTVALGILTDESLAKNLIIPRYIKEGLEWLLK